MEDNSGRPSINVEAEMSIQSMFGSPQDSNQNSTGFASKVTEIHSNPQSENPAILSPSQLLSEVNCTNNSEKSSKPTLTPISLSEELIHSHNIHRAAVLLKDAKSNRFLEFRPDPGSLRLYVLYYEPIFKWLQYLSIFIILGLVVLEEPSVWPGAVPFWGCNIIEIICFCYLGFRIIHLASFQHKTEFWKDKKNIVAIVLLSLSVLDIVCYCIWRSLSSSDSMHKAVRWSRPLRPLLIVNFPHARQIRRAFRNIRRTLIEIIFVLVLFLFSIMLFALLALKLFSKRDLKDRFGNPYFSNYVDALWNLYVLVTTANNPDVMMPAYDSSNWYALFFISFTVVNLYVFMNVLLAVIFNSYKKHLKNEVKAAVFSKRRKLAQAYDLVKEKYGGGWYLTYTTWSKLMNVASPKTSQQQIKMLFQVMDSDGDEKLTKAEFLTSADLLNIPLTEVKDRMALWDTLFPTIYNHPISKGLKLVVLHRFFRYFFDFAIVVNAVCIATDLQKAEWFFLVLFTMEIILKLYVYGPKRFASHFWNLFDTVVIGGAVIATIFEATQNLTQLQGDTLDFILVLRVLRLVKIVNGIKRFRIVVMTLVNIGPSILIYGGVLSIFYYMFAIVGMEIFHGKIQYFDGATYNFSALKPEQYFCGNKRLNGSEFYMVQYCSNNFNDIMKALVVLTELTVVNQWHVLASGFELVTHPVARLYFLFFHLSVVVLIMNIFIAFILEAFILEYSLSKSKFESRFEARILQLGYALGQKKESSKKSDKVTIIEDMETGYDEPEEGTRFHVRQSKRKVEVLLQRMFEDEIDPEDLGDLDNLDADDVDDVAIRTKRSPTLNSVVD